MTPRKANGPTSAPTLNRAGSTIPTKEKEMNDVNRSTLSSFDKGRLDSFMDLETYVIDLMHMSALTSDIVLEFFSRPDRTDESGQLVFRTTDGCRERMAFAVANVSNRADELTRKYMTAFSGQVQS